ncbi:energy-coupling factor transporter transmembrane component T family protein [Rhizobium rhizosphaerae]|uniref:energy-coupling factor transporter transmembrane component T family protein n=1 Tax=Xaviernesmea rhizosphaerae TaxID=1672749 RepID=UPI00098FDFF2|nr:energy-coupling factor transporter transmembrane protein EcfT [Xaviernesmea rhizosphaerae]
MLTSLYVEGDSWMHRLRAGHKLALLLVAGILLSITDSLLVLTLALPFCALPFVMLRLSWCAIRARLGGLMLTILILTAATAWLQSPEAGLVAFVRVTALVLLAGAVTATTGIAEMMAALTVALRPLERLGLARAEDVALAVGLVLRFVPEIAQRHQALTAAHRARGITPRWHRTLPALIVLTLKEADDVARAIDARGLRGHKVRKG